MSFEGKLMRGLKWYSMRDRDGNLPKGVVESEKINDANFYIEFIKEKDEAKIIALLKKISLMARTSKKKLPQYKAFLEELNSVGKPVKQEKK